MNNNHNKLRSSPDFKTNLQETQIQGGFGRVSAFASLSQKNGFVFVNKIWHFKALNHYSQAHKIRFRLLTNFKINSQETQIQREGFGRVSTLASLFQKNGFVVVNQIWQFKASTHYSQAHKIRFRPLKVFKTDLQETQNIGRKFWKSFNVSLAFPEKWFCIRQQNLAI